MGVLAFLGFVFGILGIVAFGLVIRLRKTVKELREDIDKGKPQGPPGEKGDRGEPGQKGDKGDKGQNGCSGLLRG